MHATVASQLHPVWWSSDFLHSRWGDGLPAKPRIRVSENRWASVCCPAPVPRHCLSRPLSRESETANTAGQAQEDTALPAESRTSTVRKFSLAKFKSVQQDSHDDDVVLAVFLENRVHELHSAGIAGIETIALVLGTNRERDVDNAFTP